MRILAIDPGTIQSAWVLYEDGKIIDKGLDSNYEVLSLVTKAEYDVDEDLADKMYIEMVASYGMAVGKSVFETCVWIGRFIEAWPFEWEYIYRKDVKMHLCGQTRAKDANIRQAILDLYGSERDIAIGTKKSPGPLYGVKKDIWAALGVAITASAK